MFFFEKKNQKTFDCFQSGDVETSRVKTRKSFLRRFFSKKRLLSYTLKKVVDADLPRHDDGRDFHSDFDYKDHIKNHVFSRINHAFQ